MAKQTKIYKTKPFWKFRKLAKAITLAPPKHVGWDDIVRDKIMPCLKNPLTGQTGTEAEKKSLMKFIEEYRNSQGHKSGKRYLAEREDSLGRRYTFMIVFPSKRCIAYNSISFVIEYFDHCYKESGNGDVLVGRMHRMFEKHVGLHGDAPNKVWDAHYEASCRFNDLINNCTCESRFYPFSMKQRTEDHAKNYWYYNCSHSKCTNSKFCFAHLHAHANSDWRSW